MLVLKNECKGIAVILKTDYTSINLKEGEHIQIPEKLILRKPECIKVYDVKKSNELNSKKQTEQKVEKVKSTKEENKKIEEPKEEKQEPKKTKRTRKKSSKKGEENA
jgi:type VI protein secretion system component VasA